jgi:hypothetical protein
LTDHPKGRDQADAQSKKAQKAAHDAKEAWALYESEARAVQEKTARLKALRLAKEAADEPAPAKKKPARSKTTPAG